MDIRQGEIYGKQTPSRFVMYNVLKVHKGIVTLQNIDNPLSTFETTNNKLTVSGYIRISQTPFVAKESLTNKKLKSKQKLMRCPYTLDCFEERADIERPAPLISDLFA